MMEPMDVMGLGRMAAIADPTGGAFIGLGAAATIGAERVNDPGCLTWNELHTPDVDAAVEFYTGLFGWDTEEMDTEGARRYVIVKVGDRSNGGVMGGAGAASRRTGCPTSSSRAATAPPTRPAELGGNELARMEMRAGKIAVMADPQGAVFALFEGERRLKLRGV